VSLMRKFFLVILPLIGIACESEPFRNKAVREYVNYLAARQDWVGTVKINDHKHFVGSRKGEKIFARYDNESEMVNFVGKEIRFRDGCYKNFLNKKEMREIEKYHLKHYPEVQKYASQVLKRDVAKEGLPALPDTFIVTGIHYRQLSGGPASYIRNSFKKHSLQLQCGMDAEGTPREQY